MDPVQNTTPTMETPQPQSQPHEEKNTLLAICSYLGFLIIIPFLVAKNDPYVHFHLKQGAVLFIIEIILWILSIMLSPLHLIWAIINLGTFILSIIGIINAYQHTQKDLPLVGEYAKHLNF